MGCNQTITENEVKSSKVIEIPFQPVDIGRYINDIRANPQKYAEGIEKELQKFIDEYSLQISEKVIYRTNEGKSVYRQAIQFLKKQQSLPPLQLHQGLCKASTCHAEDITSRNVLTHTGFDESEPIDRITRFCRKSYGKSGENISTEFKIDGRNHAQNTIKWLVIDDGVADRGHRNSVFDKDFKYYGSSSRCQDDKIITVITYLSQNWESV